MVMQCVLDDLNIKKIKQERNITCVKIKESLETLEIQTAINLHHVPVNINQKLL